MDLLLGGLASGIGLKCQLIHVIADGIQLTEQGGIGVGGPGAELDTGRYGAVLRAKGIVKAEDGRWLHFDYVPEDHQVRFGGADYTGRLCVIGSKLDEAGLHALFGV